MNNKFWIIVREVYRKNVKSWSFLVAILAPILMVGIIFLISFLSVKSTGVMDKQKIAIVSDVDAVNQVFKVANKNTNESSDLIAYTQTSNKDVEYTFISSEDKAKEELKKQKIAAYIVIKDVSNQLVANIYSTDATIQDQISPITQMINGVQSNINVQKTQISQADLAILGQQASVKQKTISFEDSGKIIEGEDYSAIKSVVSYLIVILIFFFIMFFATSITQEIASEKGTRIMEILLSSVPAKTHFYGKIVGIILVVLTQLISYVLVFGLGFLQIKNSFGGLIDQALKNIDLNKIFGDGFYMVIPIILVSFALYIVVAALCGSLVSKMEDVPKATQPIVYIALVGYMGTLALGNGKDTIILKVLSYLPFTSTFAMPTRLAKGVATTFDAWISVLVLIIATLVILRFSAKMYQSNVLIYNDNGLFTSFKEGLGYMKQNRKNNG
ncbi:MULTISPECIES: ABC transporter permease [unclassified Enterococcus]|uniref:ABC transporter permease n=1 Tax=unclassified Enterococcus TaxID=2608891 RepID=UPI001557823B|nr:MULTISPECIES: ABC transporter permease [unclassified Enterococcus]MBS7577769.1 ABC transporter permease [Enterococcus sp. MMGLQ5-2]MBS7585029.1 ABC transporter permease [Enterococcus sp. MMGLQ5-1]NPD12885.1 ABC transporter permease [Enterococcus sp. MMGLQ5-1]NPD37599.1 ABC transporter permease [Enterococcus sp. MMGLQ5-2]